MAALVRILAYLMSDKFRADYRALWGEDPVRYQHFTTWTFPGHDA